MIKILIVDDHAIVRDGLARILSPLKGIYVADSVGSGEEALTSAREHRPNIILMDLEMPGLGGLEVSKRILQTMPQTRIIVLTLLSGGLLPEQVLAEGVHGYLSKTSGTQEFIEAIHAVHMGNRYVGKDIAQGLALKEFRKKKGSPFQSLSSREMQVMTMIVRCETVRQIAESLSVSPKTVNSYRYRIFSKLNVSGDMQLAIMAIQHKIIHPNEIQLHTKSN